MSTKKISNNRTSKKNNRTSKKVNKKKELKIIGGFKKEKKLYNKLKQIKADDVLAFYLSEIDRHVDDLKNNREEDDYSVNSDLDKAFIESDSDSDEENENDYSFGGKKNKKIKNKRNNKK
jgi:hypothetical protein